MSLSKFVLSVAATLLVSASTLMATTYNVDVSHSSVAFKVRHMMVSNVKGHFSGFDGSYELTDGALKSLNGTVDVATVDTGIEKRDNHLRSADFFNAGKYPKMTFVMTGMKGNNVEGKLTLNGITKPITLETDISGEVTGPWGNKRSGMSLEGEINRKDFGLTWNKMMEAGGVVVGEEVKISIELEGIAK
jgi:polyisoprenoid-binding protein YceI